MPGERAELKPSAVGADACEFLQPVDVDEQRRSHVPHVQQRHQTLAAREDSRVVGGQGIDGLPDRRRTHVVERCGLHQRYLPG
jgi:hypothetical protein